LSRIALWYRGVEQPIEISPNGTIQFVARPVRSRYHSDSIYWLTRETQPGLRAAPVLAPGLPVAWEDDARYDAHVAAPNGDHWYAAELASDDPDRAALHVVLTLPVALSAGTRLHVALASTVVSAHHVAVMANGQALTPLTWTGTGAYSVTVSLPAVPAGQLALDLRSVTPTDVVLVDRIELPDVAPSFSAQPTTPEVTRGFGLDLARSPGLGQSGASFLIITHSIFRPALDALISAHRQRGDTVAVLDVQAVYDAFSFGERDPEAIWSLIRTAAASWSPAPRAVLLVGAGSVKMRVTPDQADPTFIPPYLVMADPVRGEIACDTCYSRLDTDNALEDPLPDLPIGRFPVRTLDEAEIVAAKTVTALTSPPPGVWRSQTLWLTDNDFQADGAPDPAGSFVQTAETGVSTLPIGIQAQKFYYAPDRPASGPYDGDVGRLRCRLFRVIDGGSKYDLHCPQNPMGAETGAALWVYVGHGSPWQWAVTSPQDATPYLFYLYDADARKNGERLPVLLSMTCLSGDWANPILQTTDERLLLKWGGGTVASLSATGEGVNTGHTLLLAGLLPHLFAKVGDRTLGAAHLAGLAALNGRYQDLAFSFGILGDPDVSMPFVPTQAVYLPIVNR
jgi:hypothetical protein